MRKKRIAQESTTETFVAHIHVEERHTDKTDRARDRESKVDDSYRLAIYLRQK